jgi:hypothetical protein
MPEEQKMKTAEQIQEKLRAMLLDAVEIKAQKYHEEDWRTGIKGAFLESRLNTLEEILSWIDEGK